MKKNVLLIFLFSLILFGNANPAFAADPVVRLEPAATSLNDLYFVDSVVGVLAALNPCSGADITIPLDDCDYFDAETGADWYRKVMSCDLQIEGVSVGRLISEYLRLATTEDSEENVWVQIRDQIIVNDALTIWGNSYNTEYNHPGAEGMATNILDASFNKVDMDLKYKYSLWNDVFSICFWAITP
ncbi:MAG: hypothetical protein GY864_07160 [Desulfobacterales bacterium]|nr:hypothetical protein [Desulfobacterales bacterium]